MASQFCFARVDGTAGGQRLTLLDRSLPRIRKSALIRMTDRRTEMPAAATTAGIFDRIPSPRLHLGSQWRPDRCKAVRFIVDCYFTIIWPCIAGCRPQM
jgi:hypothetical protein